MNKSKMNYKAEAAKLLKQHLDGEYIMAVAARAGIAYETLNRYIHGRRAIKTDHSRALAARMQGSYRELFLIYVDLSKHKLPDNKRVAVAINNIIWELTRVTKGKG